jgi:RimJ/RimL family protein N-acetyltransferase
MQPLHTSRLLVRPFVRADLDAVARLHDDCFGPAPRLQREAWLEWTLRNHAVLAQLHQPPYGDHAVTLASTGEVIGSVGLVPSFGPFEKLPSFRSRLRIGASGRFTPEMGLFWAIATAHRGAGYASEAAGVLARFALDSLHVDRLVATTEHANAASIGVMRRLGMMIERNPDEEPKWFQTVGVLFADRAAAR